MRKYLKRLTLLFGGLILLIVSFWYIGLSEIFNELLKADPLLLLIAYVIFFIMMGVRTIRWKMLLRYLDISVGYKETFGTLLSSYFVHAVSPRALGEMYRAYMVSKIDPNLSKTSLGNTFATVVIEKVFDVLLVIVTGVIGLIWLLLYSTGDLTTIILFFGLAILIACLIIGACFSKRIFLKISNFLQAILTIWPKKLGKERLQRFVQVNLDRFSTSLEVLRGNRSILIRTILISAVIWLIEVLKLSFIFLALEIPLSYFEIGYIYSISAIIGYVSMIPGGIGSQELAFIFLCSLRGISIESSGAAVLLYRSIFLIGNFVAGGITFFLLGSKVPIRSTIDSKFAVNSNEAKENNQA
ncbi:MAG: YbhN family protein [Promethearchaeota archaeon]